MMLLIAMGTHWSVSCPGTRWFTPVGVISPLAVELCNTVLHLSDAGVAGSLLLPPTHAPQRTRVRQLHEFCLHHRSAPLLHYPWINEIELAESCPHLNWKPVHEQSHENLPRHSGEGRTARRAYDPSRRIATCRTTLGAELTCS
jgi:hypothetical protein